MVLIVRCVRLVSSRPCGKTRERAKGGYGTRVSGSGVYIESLIDSNGRPRVGRLGARAGGPAGGECVQDQKRVCVCARSACCDVRGAERRARGL